VTRAVRALPCLVAAFLIAACSGGWISGEGRAAPSTPRPTAGSSAPAGSSPPVSPPGAAALASFFGPDVRPREDGSFGRDRVALIGTGDSAPAREALRVFYPHGSSSPAANRRYGSPDGGMQLYLPMTGGAADEAHLRYWVRFPDGFHFAKGGKLPGFWGGTAVSGGDMPDGTDGFSTRLMWRSGGAGEVYLYADDLSGVSLGRGSWSWPRGRWLCVEERVTLNAPTQADGSVTVWLDGRTVFRQGGIRFRTVPDLQIEGIFFSTFYGGDDPTWGPPSDEYADFAAFAVGPDRLGCTE
jgi:hypothetical protein